MATNRERAQAAGREYRLYGLQWADTPERACLLYFRMRHLQEFLAWWQGYNAPAVHDPALQE